MPKHKVEVTEYECMKCGYKWINRINGKDGIEPKRCAKCKHSNWDKESRTPEQVGLRRRVSYLESLYDTQLRYYWSDKTFSWPKGIIEKFLDVEPTIAELKQVLLAGKLKLNSQNQYRHRGWVANPDKPGYLKYDDEAYQQLLKQDAQKQQELMQKIIESRKD